MSSHNRVHNKGTFSQEEYNAAEASIYPGMLIALDSDNNVEIHDDEGGTLGDQTMFAMIDYLQGKTKDTVYTVDYLVFVIIPNVGSVVNALIEDGQDVSIGDKLCSAGNGKLKVTSDIESGETLAKVVGIAMEDRDLTVSDSDDTISAVRIV